jgi:uncharacterized RDD family membrane protein YckC
MTILFSDYILSNPTLTEFVTNMPSGDFDAMVLYMESYYNLVMLLGIFGSFIMVLFGYIYFGIIGKYTYGSLGKYAMHIRVVNLDDTKCDSKMKLYLREPLIHIMIFGMISSLLSIVWSPFGMIGSIAYYTYIILFIFKYDFWNRYMSLKLL